ncbi:MAG: FAD-dependent thymidylate synthase [Alphaproteobacteria bacterium]|nr:FAD-dependent thymidylate synthase [Alphaproteobacteria bacterium]
MKVVLSKIDTNEALNKLYTACRTCYNAGRPEDMYATVDEITPENKIKLLSAVIRSGHHSVLEHQTLTFFISGVSRALTHQLVRHRIASYSQQSQRYCEFKDGQFEYVIPPKIKSNPEALAVFEQAMRQDVSAYEKLISLGLPAEDARSVLPQACCTNIVVSMNIRSFMHFCNERLCTCAQLEIRQLAQQMAKLAGEAMPFLKPYFVPKCEMLGYCNESAKRSCHRRPTFDELTDKKDS